MPVDPWAKEDLGQAMSRDARCARRHLHRHNELPELYVRLMPVVRAVWRYGESWPSDRVATAGLLISLCQMAAFEFGEAPLTVRRSRVDRREYEPLRCGLNTVVNN
jgi:hypothetical protein